MRLSAGWVLALTVALLLNLALVAHMAAPQSRTVSGSAASPTPLAVAGPAGPAGPGVPGAAPAGDLAAAARIPPWIAWPHAGGELLPLPQAEADALQAAVDRARDEYDLSALAVGVAVRGQLGWAGASGLARDGSTVLDGHSPFAIASITKTFTASVVLQLVEERRLRLDSRVAELLPGLKIAPEVTVRQLLNHTSGVADLLAPMREPMNAEPTRRWAGADVAKRIGEAWFKPGAGFGYSNTNYVLLGLVVEQVTGRSFVEELRHRLLEPFDLHETGVLLEDGAPPLMSAAWASAFGTSGNMYASASDLLRWSGALYHGSVLRPSTRTQMLDVGKDGYGLGVQHVEVGPWDGYGHSGLLQGFTSLLVDLPAQGVTLVVIGTSRGFSPAELLSWSPKGENSILDLALAAR
jgi:D-alanyl-D-alanine carboxypeptidase